MRFGSLFTGIGGLDLGLERAGMECAWQVEIDPYCRLVLEKHWPNVERFNDAKRFLSNPFFDGPQGLIEARAVARATFGVDLVCGGFPCQPVSLAGKRRAQDDERWLWPEFARILRVLRPRYVLVENVPGLLIRGMGDVLGDLAALGYDAEWDRIPAALFGAPHLRFRVFIIAQLADAGCVGQQGNEPEPEPERGDASDPRAGGALPNADCRRRGIKRVEESPGLEGAQGSEPDGLREDGELGDAPDVLVAHGPGREHAEEGDAWPRVLGAWSAEDRAACSAGWWDVEPDVGRVVDRCTARVDRLRGLGNAVVPQVAEAIGKRIIALEEARRASER